MNKPFHLPVSGYRGVWEKTLTPELIQALTRGFALFTKANSGKRILLGRDARPTGEIIENLVRDALIQEGIDVIQGGLLPTPSIMFLVRSLELDGAIIITASHNPSEYNGLKFVTKRGIMTNETEAAEIVVRMYAPKEESSRGTSVVMENLAIRHAEHILSVLGEDRIAAIKAMRFTVVLDSINSVGIIPARILLEKLGCAVTYLNNTPNGMFAHEPEPLPKNLTTLAETVKKTGAHVGFAQDPDADRIVFCDETGTIIFEEHTVALGVFSVLSETPGDIAVNLASSRVSEMIAESYGTKTFYTKVGEGNVVESILKNNCIVGGEGSGGIIYPAMNPCRDSIVGMALILDLLARTKKPLSALAAQLPKTTMQKAKFPLSGTLDELYKKLQVTFPDGIPNTQDGIRLDFPDHSWISLRPSNTEPIARITVESATKSKTEELFEKASIILK